MPSIFLQPYRGHARRLRAIPPRRPGSARLHYRHASNTYLNAHTTGTCADAVAETVPADGRRWRARAIGLTGTAKPGTPGYSTSTCHATSPHYAAFATRALSCLRTSSQHLFCCRHHLPFRITFPGARTPRWVQAFLVDAGRLPPRFLASRPLRVCGRRHGVPSGLGSAADV